MTSVNNELSGKRLELLMEVIPKLSRVALLWNPANPNTVRVVQETETMARSLGWRFKLLRLKQLTTSMAHFEWRSKSVLRRSCWEVVAFSALPNTHIIELAAKNRLSATYPNTQFVEAGGLMAYPEDRT